MRRSRPLTNADIKLRAARSALYSLINSMKELQDIGSVMHYPAGWSENLSAAEDAYRISEPKDNDSE